MFEQAGGGGRELGRWQGRADGWWAALLMCGGGAASTGVGTELVRLAESGTGGVLVGAYAITAAVLMLYFTGLLLWRAAQVWRVVVLIDVNAVHLRSVLLPISRTSLPLDHIRAVCVVEITSPWQRELLWWLVPDRGVPLILRSGPGLQFELVSGHVLAVSVDQPQRALAYLAQLGVAAGAREPCEPTPSPKPANRRWTARRRLR